MVTWIDDEDTRYHVVTKLEAKVLGEHVNVWKAAELSGIPLHYIEMELLTKGRRKMRRGNNVVLLSSGAGVIQDCKIREIYTHDWRMPLKLAQRRNELERIKKKMGHT